MMYLLWSAILTNGNTRHRTPNKALKRTKKQLVFAPASLILTNYFLPLSGALGYKAYMNHNFINILDSERDKYIYRIMPLSRLYELFENTENVLVKPSLWEDPFENFILKSRVRFKNGKTYGFNHQNGFYGQCWTRSKASDAMWRIYSSDKRSV